MNIGAMIAAGQTAYGAYQFARQHKGTTKKIANIMFHSGGKKSAAKRMAKMGYKHLMKTKGHHAHMEKLTRPATNHLSAFRKTYGR